MHLHCLICYTDGPKEQQIIKNAVHALFFPKKRFGKEIRTVSIKNLLFKKIKKLACLELF